MTKGLRETGTNIFLALKAHLLRHETIVKLFIFVLPFDSDKEISDLILGCPSRRFFFNQFHPALF